eukprot:COSAG02_NODE_5495_length_4282_cov_2.570165_6_plen_70_part_00
MLRKLLFCGCLQFIALGSAEQILVGCALAFAFFGIQQRFQPYRDPEDNTLKSLAEAQTFLTFLVSLILR